MKPLTVTRARLQVPLTLDRFVNEEVLPGTGLDPDRFWQEFSTLVEDLTPQNLALLKQRNHLQDALNDWHRNHPGPIQDPDAYRKFLQDIGYLVPVPPLSSAQVRTSAVAPEITQQPGPQLVVPLSNARFALNAANARWGSLYDALYGTDALAAPVHHPDPAAASASSPAASASSPAAGASHPATATGPTNASPQETPAALVFERVQQVMAFCRDFLDRIAPLQNGSHRDAVRYLIDPQDPRGPLCLLLADGQRTGLQDPYLLIGYQGTPQNPSVILLCHHGLHVEIQVDARHPVGQHDPAGVKDLWLEAAVSTIMDCEDSVAAVDTEDKVAIYRNWLGLMNGQLQTTFQKQGKTVVRRLNGERTYQHPNGETLSLPGQSLLFVRTVGHLMTTPALFTLDGQEVPEGILDGVMTSLIALHRVRPLPLPLSSNATPQESIYIVKPKMHGPEEVAFACTLFSRIEDLLQLPRNTLKMGIMDEERRTSVNLRACVANAAERVVFINTGFLDRTGDEIHTSMEAGPMLRKEDMKTSPWLNAYERNNVCVGLACGMHGRAQIGKGMWAMPDRMAQMLREKIAHLRAGATTAWVPSPTAAVLHALHYHEVDALRRQEELLAQLDPEAEAPLLTDLLTIPVIAGRPQWTAEEIQAELDNNCQGILGYVSRWVQQGIGCSKVPNLQHIGLMEDRATLRISSQHIANWLHHGVIDASQVRDALRRMAILVDQQNQDDPAYQPMAPHPEASLAWLAACDLIFQGIDQPSGYTEPLLHRWRQQQKAALR